jgi:translation initiation factor 2 alpha subunit (eIF-2alpha)
MVERVEYMLVDEYGRVMLRFKNVVEERGKYEICDKIKIDHRLLNKILNGNKNYSYKVYENIKILCGK